MKKVYCLLLLLLPSFVFSQGLLEKLKQKAKERVEQKTDEGMDKALDHAENKIGDAAKKKEEEKKGGKKQKQEKEDKQPQAGTETANFKSYSHYDFIPGEEIVYAEDFSQDVVGELPLKWGSNNRGETQTIGGQPGKWMRAYQAGRFVSPYIKKLPENFTAEFDLVMNFTAPEKSWLFPEFSWKLVNMPAGDEKARKYLTESNGLTTVKMSIAPEEEGPSTIYLRTAQSDDKEYFINTPKEIKGFKNYFGKLVHVAVWVQKERLRLWINGEKIYDIPQAIPAKTSFNRFELETASSNYEDEQVGYFVSNIKFAQGAPDMRSKLITEGKLVTTGILFDVNSDKIKAESFGVLQEIAKVLKENATVNVKIVGHTDSDGEDNRNMELSKRRAAAVKQALTTQFGIEATRMETDGKGETQAVADNNTKEGKAQNRRVEFIKL